MAKKRDPLKVWEEELSPSMLQCRDTTFGHVWKKGTVKRIGTDYERPLTCDNGCGTVKIQTIDSRGYIVGTKTKYQDPNYLRPNGSGRVSAADNARIRLRGLRS